MLSHTPPSSSPAASAAMPLERVFVVKLMGDSDAGHLCGRIEHVLSGHRVDFDNADELLRSLCDHPAPPACAPGGRR